MATVDLRGLDEEAMDEFGALMGDENPVTTELVAGIPPEPERLDSAGCFLPEVYLCPGVGLGECTGLRSISSVELLDCGCVARRIRPRCCATCPEAHEEGCAEQIPVRDCLESICCRSLAILSDDGVTLVETHRPHCFFRNESCTVHV